MTPCWLWTKRPQKCDEIPVFWREMQPGYLFFYFLTLKLYQCDTPPIVI